MSSAWDGVDLQGPVERSGGITARLAAEWGCETRVAGPLHACSARCCCSRLAQPAAHLLCVLPVLVAQLYGDEAQGGDVPGQKVLVREPHHLQQRGVEARGEFVRGLREALPAAHVLPARVVVEGLWRVSVTGCC